MKVRKLTSYNKRQNVAKVLRNQSKPKIFYPKENESIKYLEKKIDEVEKQSLELEVKSILTLYGINRSSVNIDRLRNSIKNNRK